MPISSDVRYNFIDTIFYSFDIMKTLQNSVLNWSSSEVGARFVFQQSRPSATPGGTAEKATLGDAWGMNYEMISRDFKKMGVEAESMWDEGYDKVTNSLSDFWDSAVEAGVEFSNSELEQNNIRAAILLGDYSRVSELKTLGGEYAKYFDISIDKNEYHSKVGDDIRAKAPFLNSKYDQIIMETLVNNAGIEKDGWRTQMTKMPLNKIQTMSIDAARSLLNFNGSVVELQSLDQNIVDPAVIDVFARCEQKGITIVLGADQALLRKLIDNQKQALANTVSSVPQHTIIEQISNGYLGNVHQLDSASLTYEVAKNIEKYEDRLKGKLDLSGVESISDPRVAAELADVDVKIMLLGVRDFQSPEIARELGDASADRINMPNLKAKGTNPEAMRALLEYEGTLILPKMSRSDVWADGTKFVSLMQNAESFVEDKDFFQTNLGDPNAIVPKTTNSSNTNTQGSGKKSSPFGGGGNNNSSGKKKSPF